MSLTLNFKKTFKHQYKEKMDSNEWGILSGLEPFFNAKYRKSLYDSNEGWTLLRQLTVFSGQLFMKRYPETKYQQIYVVKTGSGQATNNSGIGLRQFGWYSADELGKFATLANNTDDLPSLNVNVKEHIVPLRKAGAHFKWDWEDIEAAAFHDYQLPAEMAKTARRAAERYHDLIQAVGDATYGLKGLLSDQSDTTNYNTVSGTDWIASNWSGATDAQKTAALKGLLAQVGDATGYTFSVGMLAMPGRYLQDCADVYVDTDKKTSLLQHLIDSYAAQGITLQIKSWEQLKNVTHESISAKDCFLATPLDEEAGEHRIVIPYMMKAPMVDTSHNVVVANYAKTAGVLKRQPKAHVVGNTTWT